MFSMRLGKLLTWVLKLTVSVKTVINTISCVYDCFHTQC